jgi:hypothetical protein
MGLALHVRSTGGLKLVPRSRAFSGRTGPLAIGAMSSSYPRNDSAGLARACLILAACWALAGAALALWVFRAWMQPVPAFNPNDGPIGADSNLDFWLGAALMAMPLAGLLAAFVACGFVYLDRARATGRARVAWTGAVVAAACADLAFLGTFAAPGRLFAIRLGQVNPGLVLMSAIFVMIGVAMGAVITVAARGAERPG